MSKMGTCSTGSYRLKHGNGARDEVARLEDQHAAFGTLFPRNWQRIASSAWSADARWLDLGCGSGANVRDWARVSNGSLWIVGVDYYEELVTAAAALARRDGLGRLLDGGRLQFRQVDGLALSRALPPGGFDLVHTRFVLIHATETLDVLKEMAKVLRPGGRLVLEEMDIDFRGLAPGDSPLERKRRRLARAWETKRKGHPRIGKELAPMLESLGFEHIEVEVEMRAGPADEEHFGSFLPPFVREARDGAAKAGKRKLKAPGKPPWLYESSFLVMADAPQ